MTFPCQFSQILEETYCKRQIQWPIIMPSAHTLPIHQQLFSEAFYLYSAWLYSLAKETCSGCSFQEICASRSSLQPVAYGAQMINGVLVLFQLTLDALGLQLCFTVTSLASKCKFGWRHLAAA